MVWCGGDDWFIVLNRMNNLKSQHHVCFVYSINYRFSLECKKSKARL